MSNIVIHAGFGAFLRTGVLGALRLGMSGRSVIELLGYPPHWRHKEFGEDDLKDSVFEYFGLLVIVKDDGVGSITVSTGVDPAESSIFWTDEFIDAGKTPDEFRMYLKDRGIPELKDPDLELIGSSVLCTIGNVFGCARHHVAVVYKKDGSFETRRSQATFMDTFVSYRGAFEVNCRKRISRPGPEAVPPLDQSGAVP